MGKNHHIIEVDGIVYKETNAAYLFSNGTTKKDEYGNEFPVKVWLPKSECQWDWEGLTPIDSGTMQIPEWLALEKGLI